MNRYFLSKWQMTAAGTVALLITVCFRCPVFLGSPPIAPKRPRWPTFGDWPANGAVLRSGGTSQRALNLRFHQKQGFLWGYPQMDYGPERVKNAIKTTRTQVSPVTR